MAEKEMRNTGMSDLKNGPLKMVRDNGVNGAIQMGDASVSPLSRSTTPMGEFHKGISGGKMEMADTGTVPMNRTPRRGWESYPTPMSKESGNAQSKETGYPRK